MTTDEPDPLLTELAAALRAERAVPARFLAAGRAAFTWHTVDAELAALTTDPAEPATAGAGNRDEQAGLRALTFVSSRATVEVEVTDDALLGQVAPPQPGEVTLRSRDGSGQTVPVDDIGWFRISPRPVGLFQLHLRTGSGLSVLTEWTRL